MLSFLNMYIAPTVWPLPYVGTCTSSYSTVHIYNTVYPFFSNLTSQANDQNYVLRQLRFHLKIDRQHLFYPPSCYLPLTPPSCYLPPPPLPANFLNIWNSDNENRGVIRVLIFSVTLRRDLQTNPHLEFSRSKIKQFKFNSINLHPNVVWSWHPSVIGPKL